jgi:hypothetical protein
MLGGVWGAFAVPPLGGPPPSVPRGFEVVPIPGVGVGGVLLPIPGDIPPTPGVVPPIPGDMPPTPPPVPGEGGPPPVPCARAVQALPARSTAARRTANFGCIMIVLACIELCFVNWPGQRPVRSFTEIESPLGYGEAPNMRRGGGGDGRQILFSPHPARSLLSPGAVTATMWDRHGLMPKSRISVSEGDEEVPSERVSL